MLFFIKNKYLFLLVFTFTLYNNLSAQYEISGYFKNYSKYWSNKLYLSIIEPKNQYGDISKYQIINSTELDSNGYFTMRGGGLPDEYIICRLSLSNIEHEGLSITFNPKNYVLLILDNTSKIQIKAENFSENPFDYNFSGDNSDRNNKIRELELLIEKFIDLADNPYMQSGKGKELFKKKYYNSIHNFCKPDIYPLVSILAQQHLDLETDYRQNKEFYKTFIEKFNHQNGKTSAYLEELNTRLKIIDYEDSLNKVNYERLIIYILIGCLIIAVFYIVLLTAKIKKIKSAHTKTPVNKEEILNQLTKREKEILKLLLQDYQNKEIASILNLETSTIKTHLSKIYTKLNITKRSEASIYKNIDF